MNPTYKPLIIKGYHFELINVIYSFNLEPFFYTGSGDCPLVDDNNLYINSWGLFVLIKTGTVHTFYKNHYRLRDC